MDHYSLLRISLFVSVFRASHLNAEMLFAIKKSSLQNALLCGFMFCVCVHLDQQKIDCEQSSGQAVQSCKTQQQPMVMMEQVGTSTVVPQERGPPPLYSLLSQPGSVVVPLLLLVLPLLQVDFDLW